MLKTIVFKLILSTLVAIIPFTIIIFLCSGVIYCIQGPCPQSCGQFTIFLDVYLEDYRWVVQLASIIVGVLFYLLLTIILERKRIRSEHE